MAQLTTPHYLLVFSDSPLGNATSSSTFTGYAKVDLQNTSRADNEDDRKREQLSFALTGETDKVNKVTESLPLPGNKQR